MKSDETSLFRNRNYMLLILSNVFNRFGDSIDSIVFTWLAYSITGSASYSAIVFAANRIPTVLFQPVTGVIIERRRKKYIMAVSDVVRAMLAGYILIRLVTGLPTPPEMVIVTFLISTVEAFRQPAGSSIIPEVVDEPMYTQAVSYQSGFSSGAELAGLGAAGVLIGFIGNAGAVLVDAAMFLLSAFFLFAMRIGRTGGGGKDDIHLRKIFSGLAEGARVVRASDIIMFLITFAVLLNAMLTPYNCLQSPMVTEILKSDERMLSVIGVALSLGMIADSSLYPKLSARFRCRPLLMTAGIFTGLMYIGTVILGEFSISSYALYAFQGTIMFFSGTGISILNTFAMVNILRKCNPDYLSRVSGIVASACSAAVPVVSFIVSAVAGFVSTACIFTVMGVLTLATCFVVFSRKVMPKELLEN